MDFGLWVVVGIVVGLVMSVMQKSSGGARGLGMLVGAIGAILAALIIGPIIGIVLQRIGVGNPIVSGINAGTVISAIVGAALATWCAARSGAKPST